MNHWKTIITKQKNLLVTTENAYFEYDSLGSNIYGISQIQEGEVICWFNNTEHNVAIANLIAAAPELLEAAEQALSDITFIMRTGKGCDFRSTIIKLEQAIAKAKGADK